MNSLIYDDCKKKGLKTCGFGKTKLVSSLKFFLFVFLSDHPVSVI